MSYVMFQRKNNCVFVPIEEVEEDIPPLVPKEKIYTIIEYRAGILVMFDHERGDYGICYWNNGDWHYKDPEMQKEYNSWQKFFNKLKETAKCTSWTLK